MSAPELTRCPQCGSMECGPIRCRFTMRDHDQPKPAEASTELSEPTYWEAKSAERREEFAEEDDINRQRACPDREPR
jgi:hypothetical protein